MLSLSLSLLMPVHITRSATSMESPTPRPIVLPQLDHHFSSRFFFIVYNTEVVATCAIVLYIMIRELV